MSNRKVMLLFAVLLALAWMPARAVAQVAVSATITGHITDPTGALIPGATVTIVNTNTGLTRSAETSADGTYVFPGLPIGVYSITVTKAGFRTYKQSGITLQVSQVLGVDIALQLGDVSQAVEVVGQATMLQTETSSQGQVVEQRRLADLPLDGRNPIALVSLVAGATVVNAPAILEGYRGGGYASVNGGRIIDNAYLFDGDTYHGVYANTALNYPNPDALQEFKLITHNFSAEFGRNAGAVFNAVTKSGTNQFHGSVWEFMRNDAFDARNFFADEKGRLRYNQFGLTAGGPLVKNKLFIFGSYQGFRIGEQSLLANSEVATALERAGNFSESPDPIIDPQTGEPFPGNIIPTERMYAPLVNWYNTYVPLPNNPDGRTITYMEGAPKSVNQYLVRVDYQITAKQTLTGRWFYDKSHIEIPFQAGIPNYTTVAFGIPTQVAGITHTYAITPTLLNQAHIGMTHGFFNNGMTPESNAWKETNSSMGINMPDMRPYSPQFGISGDTWVSANAEVESGLTHQYSDTLTWVRGKHTFKFGGEVLFDTYHNRSFWNQNGWSEFDGSFTGRGMADFLLGLISYNETRGAYVVDAQSKQFFGFFNDDWKVTPNLTLNLGLRYELLGPLSDNTPNTPFPNQQATFSPGQKSTLFLNAPVGLVYPGDEGIAPGLYPLPKGNLQPRLGFAWSPGGGKWAIRGGVGLFSSAPFMDKMGQVHANQPFLLVTHAYSPAGGWADPYGDFPGGNPWPYSFDPATANFVLPAAIQGITTDFQDPRIAQWNLSVQRAVGTDWLFDVSYVGSAGRHLLQGYEANPAVYIPGTDGFGNPLSTGDNIEDRRIISPGTLSTIMLGAAMGRSSFNSLQFTVTKRMSRSLSLLSSYTWSHSIDTSSTSEFGWHSNQDQFNVLKGERGNSSFDRRHVYALSVIYDLPKFKNSNWAVRNILGGWGTAGIFRASTGGPFTVWTDMDNNLDGFWSDRPDQVGDPLAVDRSSRANMIEHWINRDAFVENPVGQPGNVGRNSLYAPNSWDLDLSILRDFVISEKYGRFQFRSEFFNAFNNVNLGCVSTSIQSDRFGTLNCAGSPRSIQFGLKYLW